MKRCLNCMEIYDEKYDICPYCGFLSGTPPKVASHLSPGAIIADRYIVGTVIGYGGFGVTYLAWDTELGIKIALKEYFPTGLVNRVPGSKELIVLGGEKKKQYASGLQRFIYEARTLAKFSNIPSVVHVYNYLEENNTAYIVMELLEGLTLRDYLSQFESKRMDLEDALNIVNEVGQGLIEIHKKKVVHRDISPDNIFLCTDGRTKLLDFGAARLSSGEKTETLSVVLKPGYAPPEQYRSKSKQGPRTDEYALAATLYRMITGELPVESLDRVIEDNLKKPSEINPELPSWVDTVIMRAMANNQEVRFSNIEKFLQAINQEKTVILPDKQIKINRLVRAGMILTISLVIALVSHNHFSVYNDISGEGIPDGNITMMVPVESEADKEKFEEFEAAFEQKFEGKTIELIFVPKESYGKELASKLESETPPDLFIGTYADAAYKRNIDGVYNDLDAEQLHFYEDNESFIKESDSLPLGFDTYVIYENMYLSNKEGVSVVESEGIDIMKDSEVDFLFDPKRTGSNTDIFGEIKYSSDSKNDFIKEKTIFYIDLLKSRVEIQDKLSGYVETAPISVDGEYKGVFDCCVSINVDSNSQKTKIAVLAIRFALSEEGQNILCVSNQGMLPVNKKSFNTFKDINESLDYIKPKETLIIQ